MSLDMAERMVVMGMRANSMTARAARDHTEHSSPWPSTGQGRDQNRAKTALPVPLPTGPTGLDLKEASFLPSD